MKYTLDELNNEADLALDSRSDAIQNFVGAHDAWMDALEKRESLEPGDPEFNRKYDVGEAAEKAHDEALDVLVAAEIAYQAAEKALKRAEALTAPQPASQTAKDVPHANPAL